MKYLPINRVIAVALILLFSFVILHGAFKPADLIILLNGVLAGSLCSLLFAFFKLIGHAVAGVGKYDRIRQMTLGFALCWIVIAIGTSTSIYIRIVDLPYTTYLSVAFARYLAIVAAWLQITAPDFGLGLFHGRDRKVLIGSVAIGLIVSVMVIILQGA